MNLLHFTNWNNLWSHKQSCKQLLYVCGIIQGSVWSVTLGKCSTSHMIMLLVDFNLFSYCTFLMPRACLKPIMCYITMHHVRTLFCITWCSFTTSLSSSESLLHFLSCWMCLKSKCSMSQHNHAKVVKLWNSEGSKVVYEVMMVMHLQSIFRLRARLAIQRHFVLQ